MLELCVLRQLEIALVLRPARAGGGIEIMALSEFQMWELRRKYEQHRQNVETVLPTNKCPNRTHPILGLDNTPPHRLPIKHKKATASYMRRVQIARANRQLGDRIERIKNEPHATAETSIEYMPGVRRDKRYGSVRMDCHLNTTKPKGGMLPGTGLANYRAPNLANREVEFLRIVRENEEIQRRIETSKPSIDFKKNLEHWKNMKDQMKFFGSAHRVRGEPPGTLPLTRPRSKKKSTSCLVSGNTSRQQTGSEGKQSLSASEKHSDTQTGKSSLRPWSQQDHMVLESAPTSPWETARQPRPKTTGFRLRKPRNLLLFGYSGDVQLGS